MCAVPDDGDGNRLPMDREVMLNTLFEDEQASGRPAPSTEVPSHMSLEIDEDGEPELARFTYVDEDTCIGCKNCAFVARNTFFMEDSLGRARVYNQGGDSDDLIDEAIDSCPVNCIHVCAAAIKFAVWLKLWVESATRIRNQRSSALTARFALLGGSLWRMKTS